MYHSKNKVLVVISMYFYLSFSEMIVYFLYTEIICFVHFVMIDCAISLCLFMSKYKFYHPHKKKFSLILFSSDQRYLQKIQNGKCAYNTKCVDATTKKKKQTNLKATLA